jgi:hypothetical protein
MPETSVTLNGVEYKNSDFVASGGYGYVDLFPLPILEDMILELIARRAEMIAAAGQAVSATSATSLTIGVGAQNLTVDVDRGFAVGQWVTISYDATNYMIGQVTSHNAETGALAVLVPTAHAIGAGTYAGWSVNVSGLPLPTSGVGPNFVTFPTGPTPDLDDLSTKLATTAFARRGLAPSARTSNTALGVSDCGKLIDITSGTFTQTLSAAATLGSGWWVCVRNSGAGVITLDPDGTETIDGESTLILYPGCVAWIACDGTGFYAPAVTRNGLVRDARTSNTILLPADSGKLIDIASGTFTQTLSAAATLGSGWWVCIRNSGTGVITLDLDGTETIDGAETMAVVPNCTIWLLCDGSGFYAIQEHPPLSATPDEFGEATIDKPAADGQLLAVDEMGVYKYDADSTVEADGEIVIEPTSGVGRWIMVAPHWDFVWAHISVLISDLQAQIDALNV